MQAFFNVIFINMSAEKLGAKPLNRLINKGNNELPKLLKKTRVQDGRLLAETELGGMEVQLIAIPPRKNQNMLSLAFWQDQIARFGRANPEQLPATPLAIQPKQAFDGFDPSTHVQLMAHHPYVVLKDKTQYGIAITVPGGLQGQWENFKEGVPGDFLGTKTQIGRRRTSLAVVVRTDGGQPLMIQEQPSNVYSSIHQEMLAGGFQPIEGDSSQRERMVISKRSIAQKTSELGLSEHSRSRAQEQDLVFSLTEQGRSAGTVEDSKGLVEVVVYSIVEEEISEVIEKHSPIIVNTASAAHSVVGDQPSLGGGFRKGIGGGYQSGQTEFGKPKRTTAKIKSVRVEKPVAVLKVLLVAEDADKGQCMVAQ